MTDDCVSHLDSRPIAPIHAPWVLGSARHTLRNASDASDVNAAMRSLERAMRDTAAIGLVVSPAGHPDDYLGWALGIGNVLVFAFVREDFRRKGIGRYMIGQVIPSPSTPIPCAIWTRDLSEMAVSGFPICYSYGARDQFRRFCR